MPSIYIETFGCQMNEADSRYIAERALDAGYSVARAAEDANVVVLNTCTVRDSAERRAYGRMNHFNALKRRDPSLRLVVTGCLAEQDRDRMQTLAPHVDAVFGTRELVRLGDQLAAWSLDDAQDELGAKRFADENGAEMLRFAMGGTADGVTDEFSHLRAFVTVQRGCSYYCSFCIVPHVRGRFDHRARAEILAETSKRLASGAREIVLVGQTVNAWRDAAGADFGDLCRDVARLPGLERLAFISPHPKDFTPKIVDDLAAVAQLNPRIHLPLQSASDSLLRRMNRKYTLAGFDEKARTLRSRIPGCAITTDIIVGFPGETEDDFEATLDYVRSGVFANAFTFIYSTRRGTPAARWEQLPKDVVFARFERLVEAQNRITRAYHERKVGSVVRALICGDSKKDASKLTAKTPDNVTIVAPKPRDYVAASPWLDIAIESGHVWGCAGTVVGRASRYTDPGPGPANVIDLTALQLQPLRR